MTIFFVQTLGKPLSHKSLRAICNFLKFLFPVVVASFFSCSSGNMDRQCGVSTSTGDRLVVVDKNNLDAKYLCSFCGDLLRDDVKTECGHFSSESSLEQCLG